MQAPASASTPGSFIDPAKNRRNSTGALARTAGAPAAARSPAHRRGSAGAVISHSTPTSRENSMERRPRGRSMEAMLQAGVSTSGSGKPVVREGARASTPVQAAAAACRRRRSLAASERTARGTRCEKRSRRGGARRSTAHGRRRRHRPPPTTTRPPPRRRRAGPLDLGRPRRARSAGGGPAPAAASTPWELPRGLTPSPPPLPPRRRRSSTTRPAGAPNLAARAADAPDLTRRGAGRCRCRRPSTHPPPSFA